MLTHPRHVITLVHGTLARRTEWTRDDSPLRRAISTALNGRVEYRVFMWSGGNTNRARLTAATELATFLKHVIAERPRARHCVIAHSHGGNVALYASHLLNGQPLRIITLATPFIDAAPRDVDTLLRYLCTFLGIYAAALLAIATLTSQLISTFVVELLLPERTTLHDVTILLFAVVLFILNVILLFKTLKSFSRFFYKSTRDTYRPPWFERMIRRLQTDQARTCEHLSARSPPWIQLYVAYPYADEARRALRAVDWIGELPRRALLGLGATTLSVFPILGTIYKYGAFLKPFHIAPSLAPILGAICLFLFSLPLVYIVFFIPLLVLGSIRRVGYWDDSPFEYVHTRLYVRSRIGDARAVVCGYTLDATSSLLSLRHSAIYANKDVLTDIGAWLAKGVTPQAALVLPSTANPGALELRALTRIALGAFYGALLGSVMSMIFDMSLLSAAGFVALVGAGVAACYSVFGTDG